nr:hypothetical protein BaRGS_007333 [Batillaria attramentaria]
MCFSYLYQIVHLGEDDDEVTFSSATPIEEGDTFLFAPRTLKNLAMVDEMDSLAPILTTQVSEMAVSELPGNPNAVWTVKRHIEDEYDAYIIVSFVNATLVLSIGETVEEIYPEGIRHIRADKRVNEWRTPGKKNITKCAVNQRQVVIALSGGELVYFEMDPRCHELILN